MSHLIAPSLLSADFNYLGDAVKMINNSPADWIHLDVMDGRFVPNISFGIPVVEAVKKVAKKPLDVHLMIVEPDKYIQKFADAGADIISVHVEACDHLHRTIQQIKSLGKKAGAAINPHTPLAMLEEILPDLDLVNVMTVNPGFGGQKFIASSLEKVRRLKLMIKESRSSVLIEIDGGVDTANAEAIVRAGADVLVAGSSVFKADDPARAIKSLKSVSVDALKA